MTTPPVDEATLPAFTPMGTPCRGCGQRARQMVMFDRNCREVTGDHFHRRCLGCDATWIERAAPRREQRDARTDAVRAPWRTYATAPRAVRATPAPPEE